MKKLTIKIKDSKHIFYLKDEEADEVAEIWNNKYLGEIIYLSNSRFSFEKDEIKDIQFEEID